MMKTPSILRKNFTTMNLNTQRILMMKKKSTRKMMKKLKTSKKMTLMIQNNSKRKLEVSMLLHMVNAVLTMRLPVTTTNCMNNSKCMSLA